MKKIVAFILLVCVVLSLSACGKTEITMQEVYDAGNIDAMLEKHESVYIRDELEGELFVEKYLAEEYGYLCLPDGEFSFAEYITDDAKYNYSAGDYLRYLYISPDGVTNDFTADRAEYYGSFFGEEILEESIDSVSEKDGLIIINSFWGEELLADMAEYGIVSYTNEYALDAKTHELVSVTAVCTYEDGTVEHTVTGFTYDAEATEMLKAFQEYAEQTEDLRNVTIVTNPGTENEISQSFQVPKGLIIGFSWADEFTDMFELCVDAACTEGYDPYADTDSDITVYVKWNV